LEHNLPKYNTSQKTTLQGLQHYKNIAIGKVVSIDDPLNLNRIKVFINGSANKGGDNGQTIDELSWVTNLLPSFVTITPKVGEGVYIFTISNEDKHIDRFYLGPIISQQSNLNFDPLQTSALNALSFATQTPNIAISRIPELKGVFPDIQDISMAGRKNTFLIHKDNEIQLKVGSWVPSSPTKTNPYFFSYNKTSQAYIQIKNNVVFQKATTTTPSIQGSVTNIVSNKINLLTYLGGSNFNLLNQDNLISDDDQINIISKAYSMLYGEIVLQYLRLLKNAFLNHVHAGNGLSPCDLTTSNTQFVNSFKTNADQLEKAMLATNIKIN
jgi:hypothetical protein